MFIESLVLSIHLILSHPILLLLPSVLPSIRHFTIESALRINWPKYWSFSISPSNEYSGFISFRIVWFDILAVLGTLKSLFQHHNFSLNSYGVQPSLGFSDSWVGKESACNAGDPGSISGWEDPLEKGKATHSNILAWRIPRTVWSMGPQRVRHDWETFASLHFSLLYNPTLIYIHDYWKNHSFD